MIMGEKKKAKLEFRSCGNFQGWQQEETHELFKELIFLGSQQDPHRAMTVNESLFRIHI